MPRPKKDTKTLRSRSVFVRLTDAEYERIASLAKRDHRPVADWIRIQALREARMA